MEILLKKTDSESIKLIVLRQNNLKAAAMQLPSVLFVLDCEQEAYPS